MAPRVPFAELCAKSNFSFLQGASHPEELVAASRELDLDAIGIADRDGIYGLVRAYREAKERGGKLISGAELTILYDDLDVAPEALASGFVQPERVRPESVTLLVRDHDGYQSLCRLLTQAHEGQEKGVARLSLAHLAAQSAGLELVLGLGDELLYGGHPPDLSALDEVLSVFRGRVHIAASRAKDGLDARRTELAEHLAARTGARVFATSRALFHHGSRRTLADVLHCIRHKLTLDEAGRSLAPNGEARLRSGAQMLSLFADRPAWVERAAEIAAGLTFSFAELRYRFPTGELCAPGETPDITLRRLTEEGLVRRYGVSPSASAPSTSAPSANVPAVNVPASAPPANVPASVRAQCEKELALIERLGVAPYFISVYDVVQMARRRRILCQGRGSAANSAVCFALGVTAVDPARSNLLFERFLSAERAEPPDIDVDFEHERREEVIQELYAKYGRDRAAMVCEVISYRGRSALREVGKAFGLSSDQLDRLSSLVLRYDLRDVSEKLVRETGLDPRDERLAKAIAVARQLEGFPRHLSIHVGGFVLSAEPLSAVAPVEPARMPNRTVIPWDKDDMDTLGFFKVDVLGLGMLTCVRKSLALLHALGVGTQPREEAFDPIEALACIPAEDPVVYDAICRADTVGVFQIESRAQMSMLPRLKPRCFYDLVIEVAIVRPGPIQGGMVHPYLRRRTGEEPPVAPHPILHDTLARTLGVPLFQEQVMQIAMVGAGYSAGEADQLRRDMAAWKKHGRLERHRDRLLDGFAKNGIARAFGEALYKQVQGFGEYGFPESHAASFALIVYASSWLKTHHPAVFACALLNAQPMGFYSPSSIVQDAQRHGVEVRPPCIVASSWDNTLEPIPGEPASGDCASVEHASGAGARAAVESTAKQAHALRLGFRQVKGVGEEAGRAIEAARAEAPFASVGDLGRRAGLKKNELAALAEAGALEPIEPGRRNALWRAHAPRLDGLFQSRDLESPKLAPRLPPLRGVEQLLLDYGRLGLSVDDHPMRHVRPSLKGRVARAFDLRRLRDGVSVRVAGLVVGRQRPQTASGVTFVSLEDETGVSNLVITTAVFDRDRHAILNAKIALVEGRLERQGEVIHVLVRRWQRIELDEGQELASRSRDFH